MVNWLARCALESGAAPRELDKLAALGKHGMYPGNMRRDLFRDFVKKQTIARPFTVDVVAKNTLKHDVLVPQSVLSLPEVIESIWRNHPGKFGQLFGSNPRTFWEQLPADDPKLLPLGQITCLDNWQDITYPFHCACRWWGV